MTKKPDLNDAGGPMHGNLEPIEFPAEKARNAPKPRLAPQRNLTDFGNAERLVDRHGAHLRYVSAWGWLVWDGKRWQRDNAGEVIRRAKDTVRHIYASAFRADEKDRQAIAKHATASERLQRVRAMVDLAATDERVVARPESFDCNPMLLTVENGTIDLMTEHLRAHEPNDLITRLVPVTYDASATAPLWDGFLLRVMNDRQHLVDFLRRAIGYSLTGSTGEQCVFFCHGLGANGKSTFLETVRAMLGDYGMQADFSTFLQKRNDGIPNDLARLDGARFVASIEAESGRRLAEVVVKQLTGGDTVAARFLHREFFEFRPAAKFFWSANHKPPIRGTDEAIWRRMRLVPFEVTIPEGEQDKHLCEKLRAELPGILAWAVRGCTEWQQNPKGLAPPAEVLDATKTYRVEMDTLAGFLDERCYLDPSATVKSAVLWAAWQAWCKGNNEPLGTRTDFTDGLKTRGFTPKATKTARCWCGLGLHTDLSGGDG